MFIAYIAVAALLALALAGSAAATFAKNGQVAADLSRMGVPAPWLPWLAAVKLAGAAGLLAGLAVPQIGVAAAVGVVLFFAGAVVTHLRARDYKFAPAVVLGALAAVALALRVVSV
ncbi:DoxX family protein [Streptomyces sp. LHD-70]|uniref:DoxX family protein n=1 Tax=Streptomyces sp. LHD-70 TaxID=3072140 RepID=UPI00280D8AA8|nr:DoxX family protein [Streptomyces sp. LHD-70]MDQ8701069.1 DoxX family protein [Streptomyces sp. LHD-70]